MDEELHPRYCNVNRSIIINNATYYFGCPYSWRVGDYYTKAPYRLRWGGGQYYQYLLVKSGDVIC